MKILFLTDEFYPDFGANSLVVNTVAEELIKNGIEVFVMPACYDDNADCFELYNNIKIIRCIPDDNVTYLKNNLKDGHLIAAIKMTFLYFAKRLTRNKYLWAKDRIFARDTLKRFINENMIDVVISINCSIELGFPMYYLKKHSEVNCKWIMYMLDPFESHEYYRSHYSNKELRRVQHNMMKIADSIAATQIIKSEMYEWENDDIVRKVKVVGFPKIKKVLLDECDDEVSLDTDKVNVVCTGSKNEKVRNSQYTLALCEKFPSVNFHFIGLGWSEKQYRYKPNITFYPQHSWNAVRKMQSEADYLLNIGNYVTNQLPSKILEYISSGKPIINVCKSDKCPTISLLEKYDSLNIFESDDIGKSVELLEKFIHEKHLNINFETVCEMYKEYTPEYVANQIISIL